MQVRNHLYLIRYHVDYTLREYTARYLTHTCTPKSSPWAPRAAQGQGICLPTQDKQEMQVQSLGWEDPLEMQMATHPSVFDWKIPWTEEPGRLQSRGSQIVHD